MDQNINQYVDALFTNMTNFTQKEGIIGKPVTQGDKTFLPLVSIVVGYGGGDSASKAKQNDTATTGGMMGGALGLGAKLHTEAVIIIDKDNVMFAPVDSKGMNLIDKVPQILSNMNNNKQN